MRGRHAGELSHTLARTMRAGVASRDRRLQQIERRLATFDAGRRLGNLRTRLLGSDGRLETAIRRRQHRAQSQLGEVSARLDALSPLAVLARGYAVAWNADETRVLRDASTVSAGETIHVKLSQGTLEAKVTKTE
jgi:exodeoxyribonuclease VII large subunit